MPLVPWERNSGWVSRVPKEYTSLFPGGYRWGFGLELGLCPVQSGLELPFCSINHFSQGPGSLIPFSKNQHSVGPGILTLLGLSKGGEPHGKKGGDSKGFPGDHSLKKAFPPFVGFTFPPWLLFTHLVPRGWDFSKPLGLFLIWGGLRPFGGVNLR